MNILDTIQTLEPVFIEAGKMAKELRADAKITSKCESGIAEIDIVTSADLAVQEFVLQKMLETDLRYCELVAEENTPSRDKFAKSAEHVITLDPIDGTHNYAHGKNLYSIIVCLHNKKEPLYTFDYFPEIHWGLKIVNKDATFFGETPKGNLITSTPGKVISYTNYKGSTDPETSAPELYQDLIDKGYLFKQKEEIGNVFGPVLFFITGAIGGIYIENPSAVDGLVSLHYAMSQGFKVYNHIDISSPKPSELGGTDEYKGYYIALNK